MRVANRTTMNVMVMGRELQKVKEKEVRLMRSNRSFYVD